MGVFKGLELLLISFTQWRGRHTGAYLQQSLGFQPDGIGLWVTSPHWSICDGSSDDNRKYCSKEASREPGTSTFEYGKPRFIRGRQRGRVDGGGRGGQRAALARAIAESAAAGGEFNDLIGEHVQALLSCGRVAEVSDSTGADPISVRVHRSMDGEIWHATAKWFL